MTLPVALPYDNAAHPQVQANGQLWFGPTATLGDVDTPLTSTATTPGFAAACGRDPQVGDEVAGSGIPAGATGTAGAVTAYGPWSELRWEVGGSVNTSARHHAGLRSPNASIPRNVNGVAVTPSTPLATPFGPFATLQVRGNGIIRSATSDAERAGEHPARVRCRRDPVSWGRGAQRAHAPLRPAHTAVRNCAHRAFPGRSPSAPEPATLLHLPAQTRAGLRPLPLFRTTDSLSQTMLLRTSSATIAATLAFAAAASAQVGTAYTFSQSVGTFAPITGGTIITTASPSNTLDDSTFAVTLPFAVPFNGVSYSTIQVNTNGWISFGATSPGTTQYTPLSGTGITPGFVAAYAADLQAGYGTTGDRTLGSNVLTNVFAVGPIAVGDAISGTGIPAGTTVTAVAGNTITLSAPATTTGALGTITCFGPWSNLSWEVQGTAPNREVVVQWSNFRAFAATNSERVNFQVRLGEAGPIATAYGDCSPGASTSTTGRQVGLRGANNTFPANVNNRRIVKGSSDWATSLPGTANNSSLVFNNVAPANVIPSGLTYTWSLAGVIATNTTVGAGCGGTFASAYQLFSDAAVASAALQGNSLQLINAGTSYVGTWLPGTAAALFVPPVAPTVLATGDDGEVNVTPTVPLATPYGPQATLRISGNGIVGFGSTALTFPGSNSYTPTAAAFLDGNLGGIYAWHDYNEAEGGDVQSEEIGGVLYITYNNVESYPGTPTVNPSTLQFQLNLASGDCTIVFAAIDTNTTSMFGSSHLIGVTPPGTSLNPGSINLASGFATAPVDTASLGLTANNRPVQGAAPATWDLTLSGIQPTAVIGVDIFGTTDPNIPDLGLFGLGKSGCQLRASLDVVNVWLATGAASRGYSLTIPPTPVLNNVVIFTQSAVLGNGNAADNTTSNGIRGSLGNL